MEKVLDQDAIDALFATALAASNEASALPNATLLAERYNYANAGQISSEQMRAIGSINDAFARNLMHTVGAWLRTEFKVTLASGEQLPYMEFVDRIPEKTYVSSIRLEPAGATGLLEVELALASPIVDLLLGGTGRAEPERPLTDIEDLIMTSVVQMIVKELNVTWQAVGLQFGVDKRESAAQVARMMPAGEKTMCVCFEINMPEARGALNLCLPAVVLNTLLRKLNSDNSRPRRRSFEVQMHMRDLIGEAKVGAVLQFPPVKLRARELAALSAGTVLRLPIPRHAAAELRVGGLPLSRARAVRMGEHRGARLEGPEHGFGDTESATSLAN